MTKTICEKSDKSTKRSWGWIRVQKDLGWKVDLFPRVSLDHHSDQLWEKETPVAVFCLPSFKLNNIDLLLMLWISLSLFLKANIKHFLTWYGQSLGPRYFSGQTAAFPTWGNHDKMLTAIQKQKRAYRASLIRDKGFFWENLFFSSKTKLNGRSNKPLSIFACLRISSTLLKNIKYFVEEHPASSTTWRTSTTYLNLPLSQWCTRNDNMCSQSEQKRC